MRPGANNANAGAANGANGGSADHSLNDSNSTTQSNMTSECSEAECDREPLVKNPNRGEMEMIFL